MGAIKAGTQQVLGGQEMRRTVEGERKVRETTRGERWALWWEQLGEIQGDRMKPRRDFYEDPICRGESQECSSTE